MAHEVPAWVDGRLMPMDKLEVHRRGLRHKAVSVFVLSGDKVLLQQRAAGKYHTPGLWANTCCTHPLWDEAPEDCAVRRLDEELGITGVTPVWRQQVEYRADVGGGLTEHEVVEIFSLSAPETLAVTPNPEEVQAVAWVARADLEAQVAATPARFTPWLRIYLRDHAEAIFATGG
ncbi:MAG: isopentenyl-diphosphate delta-isomerase [Rhodobacteraceae bacterium]|nr:MAG: isopentenyl-diphosphate delta-isomerase [Paracoccaceae bacterium]